MTSRHKQEPRRSNDGARSPESEGYIVSETSTSNRSGIGFAGLLTILFIALKLTGVIAWSWWWVLAPLWICAAVALIVLGIMAVFVFGRGR